MALNHPGLQGQARASSRALVRGQAEDLLRPHRSIKSSLAAAAARRTSHSRESSGPSEATLRQKQKNGKKRQRQIACVAAADPSHGHDSGERAKGRFWRVIGFPSGALQGPTPFTSRAAADIPRGRLSCHSRSCARLLPALVELERLSGFLAVWLCCCFVASSGYARAGRQAHATVEEREAELRPWAHAHSLVRSLQRWSLG